jgi:acetylornithine deacetylase/succinyl-diaminopimelate desuccinylase-like protein
VETAPTAAVTFARHNAPRFVEELKSLLRIPSISTSPEHAADTRRAAEFVAAELRRIGMQNVRLIETSTPETVIAPSSGPAQIVPARDGHPLVYADHLHAGPAATTVLLYGH